MGPLGRFDEPRPPFAPSPLLARQPAFSGVNLGAAQEALIVLGLDARHDLLATLVEDLSSLAISDPDARALARALLDGHAFEGEEGTVLSGADLDALRQRLRRKLRPGDGRFLDTAADPEALETELCQAIGLHDRSRALRSELRDAERALGAEPSEASLAWLSDVHDRLAALQQMPASDDKVRGGRSLEQAIADAPVRKRSN